MKTMKNLAFVILPLLMLVLGLGATIDWTYEDHVPKLGNNATLRKRIEITTNAVSWPDGKKVNVAIGDFANGLGEAIGTLSNVTMLGQTFPLIEEKTDVGTTAANGSWTKGSTVIVGASQSLDFPTHKKKTSYTWSASGWIKLYEDYWKESITIGGTIRIPTAISGTYSTTGTWETKSNPKTTRSAANTNGTHSLVVKYWCSSCSQEGDTATAIGGREAHSEGECPGSNCSVRYRKCTPPSGHEIHEACGNRRCDGQDHSYVGLCTSHVSSDPANTYTGCSQKIYKCTESDHRVVSGDCGHKYRTCSKGDHDSLEASCSTDSNCVSTSFWKCKHSHEYSSEDDDDSSDDSSTDTDSVANAPSSPFSSFLKLKRRCQRAWLGHTCSKGGYTTGYDTHTSRCGAWHTYWDCDPASVELHKARTCARCNNTYRNCEGASNPCISGLGHAETVETSAEAPSTPQPNPSPPSETPPTTSPEESDTTEDEEQETEEEETTEVPEETAPARPTAVCGSGHTYFTDVSYARNQHQDRTCLRCSQTYQKCSNHGTACQNRRWHTQDDTAYMEGGCGHSYRINEKSQHASVTCTTTNANGDRCNGGSYYACQSHTHTYPAPTAPTPTPSPPENSNPNNNENEEEEEEEEEVPAAPPAPTLSYHPCKIHLTTVSGDHSYQASCSTDSTCIATSFYQCQHSSHTYPAPTPTPTPPTTVTCGAASWTGCTTDVSSSTEHQVSCSGGHSYWTCGTATAWHQDRTCTRCSQTYQNCGNSATACQGSKWHTETPQVVLVACGAASWTGCTSQLTSSTEHQVTCSGGHSYWTCGTANAWHKDRTCSRCSQTYQNCGNSATACQGSRWHTE